MAKSDIPLGHASMAKADTFAVKIKRTETVYYKGHIAIKYIKGQSYLVDESTLEALLYSSAAVAIRQRTAKTKPEQDAVIDAIAHGDETKMRVKLQNRGRSPMG